MVDAGIEDHGPLVCPLTGKRSPTPKRASAPASASIASAAPKRKLAPKPKSSPAPKRQAGIGERLLSTPKRMARRTKTPICAKKSVSIMSDLDEMD